MRHLFDTRKEHKSLKLVKKLQEEADKEWEKEMMRRKEQELHDEELAKELQAQLEHEQSNPFLQPPPPLPAKPQAYSHDTTSSSNIPIAPLYGLESTTSAPKKSYVPYKPNLTTRVSSPSPVLQSNPLSASQSSINLPAAAQEAQKVTFSNHQAYPERPTVYPNQKVYPKSPYHTNAHLPQSMSMPEPMNTGPQPARLHSEPLVPLQNSFYHHPDPAQSSQSAPIVNSIPPSPNSPSIKVACEPEMNPAGASSMNPPSAPAMTPLSMNPPGSLNMSSVSSLNLTLNPPSAPRMAPSGVPAPLNMSSVSSLNLTINPKMTVETETYKASDSFFALKPNEGKIEEIQKISTHSSVRSQDSGYDYSDMVYVKNSQMVAENPFADTHAIREISRVDPTFNMKEEKMELVEELVRRTYAEKESEEVEVKDEESVIVPQVFPTSILRASAPSTNYGYYQEDQQTKELPELPQSKNTEDRHITVASLKPGQRVWIRIHPTDTGKMLAERIHIVATYQTRRVTKIMTRNGRDIPLDNTPLFADWNEILVLEEGEPWTVEWTYIDHPYLERLAEGKQWVKQLKANFKS